MEANHDTGAAIMEYATITVIEMSAPYDEYRTDDGSGFADDVEPHEVSVYVIDDEDIAESGSVDDAIQRRLDAEGLGQWDGGNTGYDPDGTHMSQDGTITERFAHVYRKGDA